MSNVIQLHETKQAKAQGVALAVACTANRLGLSPQQVIACARAAADLVHAGKVSPAKAYSDARAKLRMQQRDLA
jgi:hypothetical protein